MDIDREPEDIGGTGKCIQISRLQTLIELIFFITSYVNYKNYASRLY